MVGASFTAEDVEAMARKELQKHCKKLGFRANAKNVEMKENLLDYLKSVSAHDEEGEESSVADTSMGEESTLQEAESTAELEDALCDEEPTPVQAEVTEEIVMDTTVPEDGPSPVTSSMPGSNDDAQNEGARVQADVEHVEPSHEPSEESVVHEAGPYTINQEIAMEEADSVEQPASPALLESDSRMDESTVEEAAYEPSMDSMVGEEDTAMEVDDGISESINHDAIEARMEEGMEDMEEDMEEDMDESMEDSMEEEMEKSIEHALDPVADATIACPRLSSCAETAMDVDDNPSEDSTPQATRVPITWSPALQRVANDSGELSLSGEHRPFSLLESPMQSPIQQTAAVPPCAANVGSDQVVASSPAAVPAHVMDIKIIAASPNPMHGQPSFTPLQAAAAQPVRPKPKVVVRPTRKLAAPAFKLSDEMTGLKLASSIAAEPVTVMHPPKTNAATATAGPPQAAPASTNGAAKAASGPAKKKKQALAGQKRKARDFDKMHERQFAKLKSITDCVPTKPEKKKRRMEEGQADEANTSASKLRIPRVSLNESDSGTGLRMLNASRRNSRPTSGGRPSSNKRFGSKSGGQRKPLGERKNSVPSRSTLSATKTAKKLRSAAGSQARMSIAERSMQAAREKARRHGYLPNENATSAAV